MNTSPSGSAAAGPAAAGASRTALSASLVLMASAIASGVLGLLRQKIIAYLFGAGSTVDAYNAAFELPDYLAYLVLGGVGSTALVSMLNRRLAEQSQEEADAALLNILHVVACAFAAVLVLAWFFAPAFVAWKFHNFPDAPGTAELCVSMTRLMLLSPLFFFAGSVLGARLLVRKVFLYQAITPVIYNTCIVLCGLLLHGQLGVMSLALGVVLGALLGSLAVNLAGAVRTGLEWRPLFEFRHPAIREWVRLTLPLMLGQTVVALDPQVRTYFASEVPGAIAHMQNARQLFAAPLGVLGPAVGLASLPFFASLWARGDVARYSATVNASVVRLMAASLLLTGWMVALREPIVQLVLMGGKFRQGDAALTAELLGWFALGLFCWTGQNLYARAFYAAGDTLTPMISGTVVLLLVLPVYWFGWHTEGVRGLVIASDVGIAVHTAALAALLHWKRMVSLGELDLRELLKAAAAGALAGGAAGWLAHNIGETTTIAMAALRLMMATGLWLLLAGALLHVLRSTTWADVLKRVRRPERAQARV